MILRLPPYLKSNYNGYFNFIEILRYLSESSDPHNIISFDQTETFEANLSAILGAIKDFISEQKKSVDYSELKSSIKEVFEQNNFFEGANKSPNKPEVVVPYKKFTPYKDIEFMDYIRDEILTKPNFPKHSKLLGKKITESIFELFENARTHGICKHIYTCGQIINDQNITRLDFTIVDMGVSIKTNVNQFLKSDLSGADAIEWAIKSGNTTKTGVVSGGLGLDIIFEFIKLNKGRIQIVSSDGYLEFFENNFEKKSFINPFHGTIANIEFNLNDKASYLLREEISLNDIF